MLFEEPSYHIVPPSGSWLTFGLGLALLALLSLGPYLRWLWRAAAACRAQGVSAWRALAPALISWAALLLICGAATRYAPWLVSGSYLMPFAITLGLAAWLGRRLSELAVGPAPPELRALWPIAWLVLILVWGAGISLRAPVTLPGYEVAFVHSNGFLGLHEQYFSFARAGRAGEEPGAMWIDDGSACEPLQVVHVPPRVYFACNHEPLAYAPYVDTEASLLYVRASWKQTLKP